MFSSVRSVRSLHTSAVRANGNNAREITSDFLARLTAGSSSSSSTHDAARSMIGSGSADSSQEGRRNFRPQQITPPHSFEAKNLYPAKRVMVRNPLLGPPVKIAQRIDPFHIRKSNPLDHTLNPLMSYAFVNQMGKIKSRAETGLGWKSQRLVGKMVRRARAMGIIPRFANQPRPGGLGEADWRGRFDRF